jgi:proto-oncogene tyrosine-protein kinase ROS
MIKTVSDEIGTVAAPALVADTLTATSLSLEWEGSKHNGTLYRLQWWYAEVPSSTWQYCRNHTWHTATSRRLNDLQPYTNYKVKKNWLKLITWYMVLMLTLVCICTVSTLP